MGNGQVGPLRIRAVTFDFWCTLFAPGQDTLRIRARRLAGRLDASEDPVQRDGRGGMEAP